MPTLFARSFAHPSLLLLPLALIGGCGDASLQTREGFAQQAVLDGTIDEDSDAVMIAGHQLGGGEMCSSFLFMPDVVLTALHCLTTDAQTGPIQCAGDDATIRTQLIAPNDTLVLQADSFDDPSYRYHEVAELHTLPDASALPTCGNDVVAVRLVDPIDDVEPLALSLAAAPVVNDSLSIVGFGASPPSDPQSVGTRRRRDDVMVAAVGVQQDEDGDVVTTASEFIIDAGACPGDSGSPAFDVSGRVVGVMSRGNTSTCELMVYDDVATHAAWLRGLAADSADRLNIEVPAWAQDAAPANDANDDVLDQTQPAGCTQSGGTSSSVAFVIAFLWVSRFLAMRARAL
jgi:hypothetical protein